MRRLRGLLADTRPLQVPAYRRLFTAQIVTVIGAQLTVVTVPAQIYSMTGSSAYVGLTGVFGLVPLVVFGLYGGSLADHFDRRRILTVTTWGLIITSALFFVQAALGNTNVWLLLTIFALQQAFFAVNQPTRSAVYPRILPPEPNESIATLQWMDATEIAAISTPAPSCSVPGSQRAAPAQGPCSGNRAKLPRRAQTGAARQPLRSDTMRVAQTAATARDSYQASAFSTAWRTWPTSVGSSHSAAMAMKTSSRLNLRMIAVLKGSTSARCSACSTLISDTPNRPRNARSMFAPLEKPWSIRRVSPRSSASACCCAWPS